MDWIKKSKAFLLSLTALFMALVCIATMVIRIPINLGYAHLGNSVVLIAVFYFDRKYGILAGSIGSALADLLTGYNEWILPTLVIKAAMALTAVLIAKKKGQFKLYSFRTICGVIISMVVMAVGYTIAGVFLYGWAAGISSALGLALEGIVNAIAFFVLGTILSRIKRVSL